MRAASGARGANRMQAIAATKSTATPNSVAAIRQLRFSVLRIGLVAGHGRETASFPAAERPITLRSYIASP